MQIIKNQARYFTPLFNFLERFRSLVRPQYRYLIVRIPATSPAPKFEYGQEILVKDHDAIDKKGIIAFIHPLTGNEHFYRGDAYQYGVKFRTLDGIDVQPFSESRLVCWNRGE